MGRIQSKELYEAKELLADLSSWSDEEIEALPRFYQEKAREYQRLVNSSEG